MKANANRFSNSEDAILYGGAILILALVLGIIFLSGYVKRKIRKYKNKITEDS